MSNANVDLERLREWEQAAKDKRDHLPIGDMCDVYAQLALIAHYAANAIESLQRQLYIQSLNVGWQNGQGRNSTERRADSDSRT